MLSLRLYMLQRITALLMAPLVLGHLAVMIYAVQGGLSAAEILGRTRGSLMWFMFYGTFVAAVAIHGAIGLRAIAHGQHPRRSAGLLRRGRSRRLIHSPRLASQQVKDHGALLCRSGFALGRCPSCWKTICHRGLNIPPAGRAPGAQHPASSH